MNSSVSRRRIGAFITAFSLTAALLIGAGAPPAGARQARSTTTFITGAGSNFIYLLMNRWAFLYGTQVERDVRVSYQRIGYDSGVSAFIKGQIDFAGADAYLSDYQMKLADGNVFNLPLTLYSLAITYNLPGLKAPLQLDGATLVQIFLGAITRWNDPAIVALNPGAVLPSTRITVVHRVDVSGTTFTLTSYLSAVSAIWKQSIGAAPTVTWPVGVGVRSSASQVETIDKTPGSISYLELSYAIDNTTPMAAIKNRAGAFVLPSLAGATADAANAGSLPADLRGVIANAPGNNSYPISGFSWVLIHQQAPESVTYAPLLKFLWWCAHSGQLYVQSGALRFAPLPPSVVTAIEGKIKAVTYHGTPLYTG